MRNGDPAAVDAKGASKFQGIDYKCLKMADTRFTDRSPNFPAQPCKFGVLTTIYFLPRWKGINLDSSDHYNHVAYPLNNKTAYEKGESFPAIHPISIRQIVLEIMWDNSPFNDEWTSSDPQPFI